MFQKSGLGKGEGHCNHFRRFGYILLIFVLEKPENRPKMRFSKVLTPLDGFFAKNHPRSTVGDLR